MRGKTYKFTENEIGILKDALKALKIETIATSEGGYMDTQKKMRTAVDELNIISKLLRKLRK